ncbi:MFS family permease [Agromyces sp. 3263]|uniref:MFS transporter n=1 Tax=Agromyces sp. 3263 TaxID=2817750 RepID=UPI00286241EF|nr:MFS transporter [Agromyces sp. 3263]MDR6906073.1 MFS family permease [Agromyces sp. 3263]
MNSPAVLPRVSAARFGVAMLFVANALVFATIVTRYPELKDRFDLTELTFGLMVACGPLGSIVGSIIAGRLVARLGAVSVAVTSSVLLGVLLMVAGFTSGPMILGAVLFVIGFADATGDVGNNAHGLAIQRLMGRSIINGLHGAWSAGAIAGALLGAGALRYALPIEIHLPAMGAIIVIGSVCALPLVRLPMAPSSQTRSPSHRTSRFSAILIAACAIAAIGGFLEDVGSTWGGIYVVSETGANVAEAAIPFVALMGALTLGRFTSDALVDRIGSVGTLRVGSVAALVGLLTAAFAPETWVVAVGLGILGLGIAPMIPLAMDAADRAPGLDTGAGLAAAATVMRVGLLASPLLVGALAEWAGLRVAIAACLLVPAVAWVLAGSVRNAELIPAPGVADVSR